MRYISKDWTVKKTANAVRGEKYVIDGTVKTWELDYPSINKYPIVTKKRTVKRKATAKRRTPVTTGGSWTITPPRIHSTTLREGSKFYFLYHKSDSNTFSVDHDTYYKGNSFVSKLKRNNNFFTSRDEAITARDERNQLIK